MHDDPFPECPPVPKGSSLSEKRRIVSKWGKLTESWRLRQAKDCGAEWMEWCGSGLDDMCAACRAADGIRVRMEEFTLEAHYAACSCPDGCMCICGPTDAPDDSQATNNTP